MRVECFSTGRVRLKRGERGIRRYVGNDWSDETLPVNVFAVEHPAGLCLFDTGQTAQAAVAGYFPAWYPFFRLARFELTADDEITAQIDSASVRWVVLSHLHTDHVGGLAGLTHAEVLVSRVEWERAAGIRGRLRGYLPRAWPPGLEPRLVRYGDGPVGPFTDSLDIAGDGRLLLVPTPGHTRGHMSMLVRDEGAAYICAGDLAHSARELTEIAPEIAEFCRRERVAFLATHDPRASELLGSQW